MQKCEREQRVSKNVALLCLTVIALVFGGIGAAWNQYVYGDWKCLFADCRKIMVSK